MSIYLEHANITVPDIDQAIAFLQTIEPTFRVRHQESPPDGHRWAHVGNERCYVALQEAVSDGPRKPLRTYANYGVNHLAWVVDDFDAVFERLVERGYRLGPVAKPHRFRKRAYFFDHAGFEWEILQYLSADPAERNVYEPE